jgi:hypothetical protein
MVSFIVSPIRLPFTGILGVDIMERFDASLDPNKKFSVPGKIFNISRINVTEKMPLFRFEFLSLNLQRARF